MKGRMRFPVAPTACTRVVYSRSLGCSFFAFPGLSEPVTTSWDVILPIKKPVSSKFQVSSSRIPYFAFINWTSSNQGSISARSSQAAHWRLYGRLHRVRSSGVRLINLLTQFLPVGLPPRSPSSLSAISRMCAFESGTPRRLSLSTRCIITSSSSFVRLLRFGSQSRRARRPARRS
jgi:hypothetical protein